jgi:hypothetical protein
VENWSPEVRAVLAVLTSFGASTLFLLALLIGFSVAVGFSKLRTSGAKTLTVRSLDERLGQTQEYLPPTAPRGPADQLATPELLEVAARKSG